MKYCSRREIYVGGFHRGKKNGKGIYKFANGNVYEGLFVDGIMEDMDAKFTYKNGSVFKGSIVNCVINGKGKMTYSNNDVYEGM